MRALSVLTVLLLAGCKLVDQTTFAPSPEDKTAAAAAPAPPNVDTRTPLVTIGYDTPNPNYRDVLHYAVRQAETRAPGVQYDVIGVLPSGSDAAAAQQRVADVMRAIMADDVAPDRIHLGLRTTEATAPQQVRVYVR